MAKEKFPSFEEEENYFAPGRRLEMHQAELRREAKDLRMLIERTPASFPNRERLIRISDEILQLVPIANQKDEDRDEAEREALRKGARDVARMHHETQE